MDIHCAIKIYTKTVTQTAMMLHNVIKYKCHGVLGNLNEISVMCQRFIRKVSNFVQSISTKHQSNYSLKKV